MDDTAEQLHAALTRLQQRKQIPGTSPENGRALSLAITKLEEALMWLEKAHAA